MLLLLILLGTSARFGLVEGTIILSKENQTFTFPSQRADFGWNLCNRENYEANLRVFLGNEYMCDKYDEMGESDVENLTRTEKNYATETNKNWLDEDDGRPMALLVKKGLCPIKEKVKNALEWNRRNFHRSLKAQAWTSMGLDCETKINLSKYTGIVYLILYNDHSDDQSSARIDMDDGASDSIDMVTPFQISSSSAYFLLEELKSSFPMSLPIEMNNSQPVIIYEGDVPVMWDQFAKCGALFLLPFIAFAVVWFTSGGRIRLVRRESAWKIVVIHPPRRRIRPENMQQGNRPQLLQPKVLLTSASVHSLPEMKYSFKSETNCTSCSICLSDYEEGEMVRLLKPCGHIFHTECILPWLTERQCCCPLCKTKVKGDFEEEDNDNGDQELPEVEQQLEQ